MTGTPESVTPIVDEHLINELTTRAVDTIYPSPDQLADELRSGRQLHVYMGIDPTAPDIHIGHESQLLKLKRFQDLGHRVTLLIGDFTATIGDPTDKSAARVKLTPDEVRANAEGYEQQAGKILDFDHPTNPIDLRYNSEWLGRMSFADVLELASEFTVQQMLERDMFERRLEAGKPIGLHEFLYPTMQGWDSVSLDVDVEVGGSDQIFNMLVGSTLLRRHTGRQKFVVAGQLLVDPGGRKMGKTEGNMITMNDAPLDMFHKVMMWGDGITPHALELCTQLPMTEVEAIRQQLDSGELSGIEGKRFLAKTLVTDLHGEEAAVHAEQEYRALTSKDSELDITLFETTNVQEGQGIIEVLVAAGLASSKSQARRLVEGQGVRVNGNTVGLDWSTALDHQDSVLQVGKKKLQNHRRLTFDE